MAPIDAITGAHWHHCRTRLAPTHGSEQAVYSEVDTGQKSGVSTDAQEQIRKLKRENAELRRANEILKTAYFARDPQ